MKYTFASLLLVGWTVAGVAADAANWPAFRGPNGSGVSATAKPPAKFSVTEGVRWKIEVPGSPSSPCVWGNRLFLTTFADGKLEIRAYDTANGKLVWSHSRTAEKLEEYHGTEGSPAAATPATDGKHVVTYFGSTGLSCYDLDGKSLWHHPLLTAVTAGNFGSGASPIIVGDLMILNRDQARNSSIMALNLRDGKKVWETPRADSPTSYGTPVLSQADGAEELIVAGSLFLKSYELKTGKERWLMRGLPSYTCTTPVLGEGMIFFAGWSPGKSDSPWPKWETMLPQDKNKDGVITVDEYQNGPVWFKAQDLDGNGKLERSDWDSIGNLMKRGENVLLAVKPGGKGDVTATHVAWKFSRGLPYVPSPLYYNGRVYMVKDGGMASCFEAATGKPVYVQERLGAMGSYYASPIAADGRLFFCSLDGKVSVIKAGTDKPEVLHQAEFGERIAATPALAGESIYIRTATKLYAIGK